MTGIPVLTATAKTLPAAWEKSLTELYEHGCDLTTQYDKPGDPPSKDATMLITVEEPLAEPMIHIDLPGGLEDLQEYVMEILDGIKDHCIRDPGDPDDTRWEYTYHQRLRKYDIPSYLETTDQLENICKQLAETSYTRRAQAITWKPWEDNYCYDPPCLQSLWFRITDDKILNMNVRFRSNDAYKAAFMNMFALVQLQTSIAKKISELTDKEILVGRYCHIADSYHIYGSNLKEFENRFLNALEKRSFEKRTLRYSDMIDYMESSIPSILEKAKNMG